MTLTNIYALLLMILPLAKTAQDFIFKITRTVNLSHLSRRKKVKSIHTEVFKNILVVFLKKNILKILIQGARKIYLHFRDKENAKIADLKILYSSINTKVSEENTINHKQDCEPSNESCYKNYKADVQG